MPPARYGAASLVVVNKLDQLPCADRTPALERVQQRVRELNPHALVVGTVGGRLGQQLELDDRGGALADRVAHAVGAGVAAADHDDVLARRDRRMRTILETAKFPEIVFELTRFTGDLSRFRPGETFPVQVSGNLTVHGRTVPIQLPVDVYVFADRVEVAGSFPLDWKNYGIQDPSFVTQVKSPMLVVFRLRAVPAKVVGTPAKVVGTGPGESRGDRSRGPAPTAIHPGGAVTKPELLPSYNHRFR